MDRQVFEAELLKDAEEMDRKGFPAQIALLQKSYDFFKEAGFSEKQIKEIMALTPQQLHLLARGKKSKKRGSRGS